MHDNYFALLHDVTFLNGENGQLLIEIVETKTATEGDDMREIYPISFRVLVGGSFLTFEMAHESEERIKLDFKKLSNSKTAILTFNTLLKNSFSPEIAATFSIQV